MTIPSCYEIPSGAPVPLPLGHMAITGQTQEAGKTTAIEALALRSNRKAIAFVTKRGEGSFIVKHPIPPYFAEPVNDAENPLWKWVKGILESNQQRKMTFEEAWLIKACQSPRQAKNLADVAANIKALLAGESHVELKHKKGAPKGKMEQVRVWTRKPVSGMNESIYTSLDAYFQIVLPQLAKLPESTSLKLRPGLNVMDLSDYATDTQALVIRSVLEWVYRHEQNTTVIIPEAWEFVPRGKNSPVRMAAEIFIRKAAAMKNFLWIDSQDMEGVDYVLLRGIKVWLLGVQRQRDEVQRTLDSIPDLAHKPRKTEILTLKKGQFFACFGTEIKKVYVQPAWMESEVHAQAIARGEESVENARKILDEYVESHEEETEDDDEREEIESDPRVLDGDGGALDVPVRAGGRAADDGQKISEGNDGADGKELAASEFLSSETEGEDPMWREKYEELKAEHDQLVSTHDALAFRVGQQSAVMKILLTKLRESGIEVPIEIAGVTLQGELQHGVTEIAPGLAPPARVDSARSAASRGANGGSAAVGGNAESARAAGASPDSIALPEFSEEKMDALWAHIRRRARQNELPTLALLAEQPQLRVKIDRPVLEVTDQAPLGRIAILIRDGFFKSTQNVASIVKESARRGWISAKTPHSRVLPALRQMASYGYLLHEGADGFQAVPGMKIQTVESK